MDRDGQRMKIMRHHRMDRWAMDR